MKKRSVVKATSPAPCGAIRKGHLRVQVDRWPLTDGPIAEHVLTVIVVGAFTSKPEVDVIIQQLQEAQQILRRQKSTL